ncbi:MAG: hypothetical protein HYX85_01240 [Chloroflexi bacterium]|nr:hypothetical protein [Chloroflexota bacterium]
MKGFSFADWLNFDESRPKLGFDIPPAPPGPAPGPPPPPPSRLPYPPSEADPSLKNLAATGTNWISLVVNVGQENISSTTIFRNRPRTATNDELLHVVNLAHSLGMRVMLMPTIGLSNDPDHWPGLIGTAFISEEQWQEWFASYREFINYYAAFSQEAGVDMLSIGHELGGTTHREDDWRRIAQEVRQRFKGPITYASLSSAASINREISRFPWGDEIRITWWDAVDYIGVDAWYMLTNKNDPTVEELKAAWTERDWVARLESLSGRFNKPIIFTEFGYESKDGTNKQPANYKIVAPIDLQEQADCYQAALEVLWGKPWLKGIFWWQWFANTTIWPGGPNDKGMTPYGKPAEEVLKKFYISP